MAITVNKLKNYIAADFNVIITGAAGTGKTGMLMKATEDLGLRTKYFSAGTLDPWSDLTGLPIPDTTRKVVDFYRPLDVDNAEVIFFDELNRAEPKTLNAVFEIIQFRSINGAKLPNLKCVVAAVNPVSDEYDTEELDLALLDRFDVYLNAEVEADYNFYKNMFGTDYARAGIAMFKQYQKDYNNSQRSNKNKMGYFSPRRLEKLMTTFALFPTAATIREVLPHDVVVSAKDVAQTFNIALGNMEDKSKAPVKSAAPKKTASSSAWFDQMGPREIKTKKNSKKVLVLYADAKKNNRTKDVAAVRKKVKDMALLDGVGAVSLGYYDQVLSDLKPNELQGIINAVDYQKKLAYRNKIPAFFSTHIW